MALSSHWHNEAEDRLKKLLVRRAWWDDTVFTPLTMPGPGPAAVPSALDDYCAAHNAASAEETKIKNKGKHVRHLSHNVGNAESRIARTFKDKGITGSTDLSTLRAQVEASNATMHSLRFLQATTLPPLSREERFFNSLNAQMATGKHAQVLDRLQKKSPPWYRRVFMSKEDKELYREQLSAVIAKVSQHRTAALQKKDTERALNIVENQTVRAISVMLRHDAGGHNIYDIHHKFLRRCGGGVLDPFSPQAAALAAGNPSVKLLLDLAGGKASNADIRSALRKDPSVSLASLKDGLSDLEKLHRGAIKAAKLKVAETSQKLEDCNKFIEACRHARNYELTAATGTTRRDLIDALQKATAPGSTATDDLAKELVAQFDAREAKWVPDLDKLTVKRDADALARTSTFTHAAYTPPAGPAFNKSAQFKERVGAATAQIYDYARMALTP